MKKICTNDICNSFYAQYIIDLYEDNNNNQLYQNKNSLTIENNIGFSEELFCKNVYMKNRLGIFAYYKIRVHILSLKNMIFN